MGIRLPTPGRQPQRATYIAVPSITKSEIQKGDILYTSTSKRHETLSRYIAARSGTITLGPQTYSNCPQQGLLLPALPARSPPCIALRAHSSRSVLSSSTHSRKPRPFPLAALAISCCTSHLPISCSTLFKFAVYRKCQMREF